LDAAGYNKKLVRKSIEQAADRFTDINAHIIIQSVTAVAETAGFNRPLTNRQGKGTGVLVIGDADGRALVAKVSKTREGVQLHLDMTGFCNEKCHPLMDHILKGLAERQIILDNPKRRSHFRPDGVLPSESRTNTKTANAHKASEQQDARQRNRRRQAEQMKVRA
jgi:hypothetical protein